MQPSNSSAAGQPALELLLEQREFLQLLTRSLLANADDADDLAQDVWVASLEARDVRNWRHWLGRVARNLASNRRRGDGRRRRRDQDALPKEPLPTAAEIAEREETRRRVVECLFELSDPYKAVLLYRYYEGLTPTEIATHLDVPVDTVKTQLKRGLELLRRKLDGEYGDRRAWSIALLPFAVDVPIVQASRPATLAWTGGLLVTKKLILAASILALCLAGYWWGGFASTENVSGRPGRGGDQQQPSIGSTEKPGAKSPEHAVVAPEPEDVLVARIIDGWSGDGLAGVRVSVVHPEDPDAANTEVVSSDDGTCRFTETVAPSSLVQVRADGYVPVDIAWRQLVALPTVELRRGVAVRGRVIDDAGAAVARAELRQMIGGSAHPDGEKSLGYYRFQESVTIEVDELGHFQTWVDTPDALFQAAADGCAPAYSEPPVPVGEPVVLRLQRCEPLRGLILDHAGNPLAGVSVVPTRDLAKGARWAFEWVVGLSSVQTDADGRFVLTGLSGPDDEVEVVYESLRYSVDLPAAPTDELVIAFPATVAVEGRLVETSGPLAGAVAGTWLSPDSSVTPFSTDESGNFRLRAWATGRARLETQRHLPYPVEWEDTTGSVALGDIVLTPGPVTEVKVRNGQGEPIAGASVLDRRSRDRVDCDESGSALVPFGGRSLVAARCEAPGHSAEDVDLHSNETNVEVVLHAAAEVRGSVVTPEGTPAFGARVAVQGAGVRRTAITHPDGTFRVTGVTAGGEGQIVAKWRGYQEATPLPLSVAAGERVDVGTIVLKPGASLSGRVVDTEGTPVSDAVLICMQSNAWAFTDAQGEYRLTGVPDGDARIHCRVVGAAHRVQKVTVAGDTNVPDFVVDYGIPYAATVVDTDGNPVVGVRVRANLHVDRRNSVGVNWGVSATTDESGHFSFDKPLPRLPLRLRVSDFAGTLKSLGVDSVTDLPSQIVTEPVSSLSIEWRVSGTRALPERIACHFDRGNRGGSSRSFNSLSGGATIHGFKAGSYTLQFVADGFPRLSFDVQMPRSEPVVAIFDGLAEPTEVVVQDANGEPISDAKFRLLCGGRAQELRTDANGITSTFLDPGTDLELNIEGFAPKFVGEARELVTGGRLVIELERSATLRVVVSDDQGALIDGVEVGYHSLSRDVPQKLILGTRGRGLSAPKTVDGEVVIDELVRGPYRLTFTREGRQIGEPLDVELAEIVTSVRHTLPREIDYSGHIRIGGRAVSGGTLKCGRDRVNVASDGTFLLPTARSGWQRLTYEAPDSSTRVATAGLDSGQRYYFFVPLVPEKPLELAYSLAALTGRIYLADGAPAANLELSLYGPATYDAHTDSEGRFTIRNVAEGNYRWGIEPPAGSYAPRTPFVVAGDTHVEYRIEAGVEVDVVVERAATQHRGGTVHLLALEASGEVRRLSPGTSANGFVFPVGRTVVAVQSTGVAPAIIEVDSSETRRLSVPLHTPGGRVVVITGRDDRVLIDPVDGQKLHPFQRSRVSSYGQAALHLPVGRYRVSRSVGGRPVTREIKVSAGGEHRVDLSE